MRKIIIILLLCIFSFSSIGYAERNEWQSYSYDLEKIKRILVLIQIDPKVTDANAMWITLSAFETAKKKAKHLKFVTTDEFVAKAQKDFPNESLKEKTPEEFSTFVQENSAKYADAVLVIHVTDLGYKQYWEPPKDYTIDTTEKATITRTYTDSDGKEKKSVETIEYPVTKNVHEDGYYYSVAEVQTHMNLLDAKTQTVIWRYSNGKDGSGRVFRSSKPNKLILEIFQDAMQRTPAGRAKRL